MYTHAATAPVAESSTSIALDDLIKSIKPEESAAVDGELDDPKVLTIEEQREVAFKVVFFFIGLIAASFGVLYVYHRMTQAKVKSVREKQTL